MRFSLLVLSELPSYLRPESHKPATQSKDMDMAVIDTPRVQLASGANGRIGRFFANALASVIAWNDARVTRNVLSQLTDRELEDIGLCRGDIETIAGKH